MQLSGKNLHVILEVWVDVSIGRSLKVLAAHSKQFARKPVDRRSGGLRSASYKGSTRP